MTDTSQTGARRKPRLVLMGEFSAGKSTLSNILLEGEALPMRVTATRLPPVHITYGPPSAFAEHRDGTRTEINPAKLGAVNLDETRWIHLTMEADTLELCDLIDMPGISDPNMPSDIWDAVMEKADHVIWCTHATQAWRQSEAATWGRMLPYTRGKNLLLITQFDKLRNPRDKSRVLNRVRNEVDGLFTQIYPVSLLEALEAGDDYDAWQASGAAEFLEHLVEILMETGSALQQPVGAKPATERPALPPAMEAAPPCAEAPTAAPIVPRRVHVKTTTTARPRPDDVADLKLET
ncbi:dynamin family protein [Sinirhodobacter sp. HNIBRBA609]|nr:dynamin family protein [Sinirhodobacter sp. HNIBRBA609]